MIAIGADELGVPQVTVANLDRRAALRRRPREQGALSAKGAQAEQRIVAEPERCRVGGERMPSVTRDELRAAPDETGGASGRWPLGARPVAPRGDLGEERRPDANELEPRAQMRERDVVGGHTQPRAAEETLAAVDRLPPLLERREVPALASRADDPEPSLHRIERQPPSYRAGGDVIVGTEVGVAEEAGGVHESMPLVIPSALLSSRAERGISLAGRDSSLRSE